MGSFHQIFDRHSNIDDLMFNINLEPSNVKFGPVICDFFVCRASCSMMVIMVYELPLQMVYRVQ